MKVFGKMTMPTIEVDSFTLTEMYMKESKKSPVYGIIDSINKNFYLKL